MNDSDEFPTVCPICGDDLVTNPGRYPLEGSKFPLGFSIDCPNHGTILADGIKKSFNEKYGEYHTYEKSMKIGRDNNIKTIQGPFHPPFKPFDYCHLTVEKEDFVAQYILDQFYQLAGVSIYPIPEGFRHRFEDNEDVKVRLLIRYPSIDNSVPILP